MYNLHNWGIPYLLQQEGLDETNLSARCGRQKFIHLSSFHFLLAASVVI